MREVTQRETTVSAREKSRLYKRPFDLLIAGMCLAVTSPLLAVLAIAIKLDSPGPILYRGVRIGRNGVPFKMFKFRTMVVNADKIGGSSTPADDARVTRVGRFLRQRKLDELPQFINVVRGEMSVVGPRPQVGWAVALYGEEEREVLKVRPGLTDAASIRFRNEDEILRGSKDPDRDYMEKIHPEKMRLSLAYVRDYSLRTDIAMIAATLAGLVRRSKP